MPVQKEALFRGFRVALGKQYLARLLVTDGQTVLFQRRNGLVHVRLYQKVRGVARTHGQIEPRPCMAALVDIVEIRHDRARGIVPTAPPFPIAKRQFDGRLAPQRVEDVPRLLARDASGMASISNSSRVSGRSSANTRRPQNTGSFKSEIICRTVASDMAAVFVSTRSPLLDLIDFDSS